MPFNPEDLIVPQSYLRDAEKEIERLKRERMGTHGDVFTYYSEMIALWNGSRRFWLSFLARWDRKDALVVSGPEQGVEA